MSQVETEAERLSRECRELYDELYEADMIDGTYEEWFADAAKKGAKRLDPSPIITPVGVK